jgi:hypothetical protein
MALTKVPSNLDATIATTQSQADNSTNIATTAYVDLAISNLSDSAPAALNTLNEIAAALGDDANYASTTTAAIAGKLPLAGGTMTGNLTVNAIVDADNYTINGGQGTDGQVLTSTGTGVAWESIPAGTTINNNAVNRIITGSGTANTLNGDANFTYNGTTFALGGASNKSVAITSATSNKGFLSAWQDTAMFGINRDPATGTMTQTGRASALIKLESYNTDAYIGFQTSTTNNAEPTERMRIDSSGNVGIGTTSPKDVLHIQTAGGDGHAFGGKSLSLTTSFQTGAQLAITLGDHQACYVKVFITGDWSSRSAIAFLGEYFIQNGAGGYAEPGVIIREVDNTATVDSISSQINDQNQSPANTFQIMFKLNQSFGATSASGSLNYQIMGQFDTIT